MNLTNMEITQAAIEAFGFILCLVLAITIRTNNPKRKSLKMFIYIFAAAAICFLGEGLAIIYRGNVGLIDVIMTRAGNLAVFIFNIGMAYVFIRYVYYLCREEGLETSTGKIKVSTVLTIVGVLIPVINIFTNWMYYFDEENYYHRNFMWYVYAGIFAAILFIGAGSAIRHRKVLGARKLLSALIFAIVPIVAAIAQAFVYGLPIGNMGLGIGVLAMLIIYLYDWTHSKKEEDQDESKGKKRWIDMVILFMVMVMSMSASILSCVSSINSIANENSQIESTTIGHMVSAGIENEFIRPITVSDTMSQDYNLKRILKSSGSKDEKNVEGEMIRTLESIRGGFDYQTAFVVSEETRAYFTFEKIVKHLDWDNDPHDIWYKDFIETGKKYDLNVDTDEVNDYELAVFVNTRVEDDDGSLLGACGVAVQMNQLMENIRKYEEEYNIQIVLVDKNGLIQVDSDISRIEEDKVDTEYFSKLTGEDFYIHYLDGKRYLTKYINDLDWYLVIEDLNPQKIDVNRIIVPAIIIFMAGVVIMAITFGMMSIRENRAERGFQEKLRISITDELTGLYNRRGFENASKAIKESKEKKNYCIVMMDLNGLKYVNDNIGHDAGDELIIGSAHCMENAFSHLGKVFRVGGDEFIALLECSREKLDDAIATFNHLTSNWKGVHINELTVSLGAMISSENPDMDFDELRASADKLMYADKEAFYNRTGRDRRRG